MADLVHKSKVVPFLGQTKKVDGDWVQIKKSSTFTLSMNPQTRTYDFISDQQPQTEIAGYQPSLAQQLTMFKGEKDYQIIFDMMFKRVTGADAHRPFLLVFYQEKANCRNDGVYETVYKAWLVDSTVSIGQLDTVNESISFDLNFGDTKEGVIFVRDGKPKFVEGEVVDGEFFAKAGEVLPEHEKVDPLAPAENETEPAKTEVKDICEFANLADTAGATEGKVVLASGALSDEGVNVVQISCKGLKEHINGAGDTGYWVGFALGFPDTIKKFKYAHVDTRSDLDGIDWTTKKTYDPELPFGGSTSVDAQTKGVAFYFDKSKGETRFVGLVLVDENDYETRYRFEVDLSGVETV